MKTVIGYFLPVGAAAALMAATGCSSIPVQTRQNVTAPFYPPTSPATVQILREAPVQPSIKLGEITVEPQSTRIPVWEVEAKLREAGAKLGANAVVIVLETKFTGAIARRDGWDGEVSTDIGQVFIGVPIRYTEQKVARRAPAP